MDGRARRRLRGSTEVADDGSLELGQSLEPSGHASAIAAARAFCQVDERPVVASLRRKKLGPQRMQLDGRSTGGRSLGEELEPLARTGLDKSRHEQSVPRRGKHWLAGSGLNDAPKLGGVAVDRGKAQAYPPRGEERENALKVIDLL